MFSRCRILILLFKYVDTRENQVEIVYTRHSLLNYAAEIHQTHSQSLKTTPFLIGAIFQLRVLNVC